MPFALPCLVYCCCILPIRVAELQAADYRVLTFSSMWTFNRKGFLYYWCDKDYTKILISHSSRRKQARVRWGARCTRRCTRSPDWSTQSLIGWKAERLPIVLFNRTIQSRSAIQRLGGLIRLYLRALTQRYCCSACHAQTAFHLIGSGSHYFVGSEPNSFISTKTVATPSRFVLFLAR